MKRIALFFTIITLILVVSMNVPMPRPAYAQPTQDPCRDAEGNEICPHYEAPDGRLNYLDATASASVYCRGDRSLEVYGIVGYDGFRLFAISAETSNNALAAAQARNQRLVIQEAQGRGLAAWPGSQFELYDVSNGYVYRFGGAVCGLSAEQGNAAAFAGGGSSAPVIVTAIPVSYTHLTLPTTPYV